MKPIASNTQRVCTRLTRKPVATDETAKSKKKAVPLKPSDVALNRRVVIRGMTVPEENRVRAI